MCGIFALLNSPHDTYDQLFKIIQAFEIGNKRGPDSSKHVIDKFTNTFIGFHRLAINGLNPKSDQPMIYKDIVLICNGEIYNFKKLFSLVEETPFSDSDCEIIIHLYNKYGFETMINMLDGVFAFCLFDIKKNLCYVARDPFGVRPLYYAKGINNIFAFSSVLHSITELNIDNAKNKYVDVEQFNPGTYSMFSYEFSDMWEFKYCKSYFNIHTITANNNNKDLYTSLELIRSSLEEAVKKRVYNCDRDIVCLLSGGLDSSLITSLVNKYYHEKTGNKLKTFSIGMSGSEDLKYAKIVAEYLGTKHYEIELTEEEFIEAIPSVIQHIESYDTTSVRASVGNFLVSKYIRQYTDAKVIFNGDGSDEVTGGYLYFHYSPNHIEFDLECKRLLQDICYFDVLRSDRSISSNGLEPRTPFLDREFVTTYLSIPSELRYNTMNEHCEKYLLRKAFDDDKTLPKEVLWRTKEAFSDGVSKQTKSWFQIIQDYVDTNATSFKLNNYNKCKHNNPTTKEQIFYRTIFNSIFGDNELVIPYFWMPRFINANDASARTLDIYNKKINKL
jgi:asparagine synthase (glutamine-hydrolysing)